MSLIESVRDYMMDFDGLDDLAHFGVNYADEIDLNYSIDEIPSATGGIREMYMNGSSERELLFQFAAHFPYSQSAKTNIKSSAFFEKLSDWIEINNNKGNLPELPDGMTPLEIEVVSPAYFMGMVSETMGRYQMTIRLIYDREEVI